MTSRSERRRASRIAAGIEARLRGPDGVPLSARLENLSIVGLNARVPRTLPEGSLCQVELFAGGVSIEARGTVVRVREDELAVRFLELPYECYERLRTFLLAHAEDPAVIADELEDRLGFLGERSD